MTVSVQNVELYDLTTTEDPWMTGFYYVDMRAKAYIQTLSPDCSVSDASVCICDSGGCVDGPYPMSPDSSLGPNWYSSGLLSSWGVFTPSDQIKAHVDATEQCWSEDTGSGDSSPVSVPGSTMPPPGGGPPAHPGPRAVLKKKAAGMAAIGGNAFPGKKKKKKKKKKKG